MKTSESTCPRCGADVRPNVAGGLCPACVLRQSLAAFETPEPEPERGPVDPTALAASCFAPPQSKVSCERFGDYRIEREIGRGGMGIIYQAHQFSLNRLVALKMILAGPLTSADLARRLRLEAEAAASLDHPNIVPIYEVGEHEGGPFYSMGLVDGTNLAQALEVSRFEPDRAARLIVTVARAIQHAHERGVLHRDLKPSNILLDVHGEPHVTDFGLAKIVRAGNSLTLSHTALGTPNYMAPEQASGGSRRVTTAADVYSLGAILYELLTSRPLVRADTPLQALQQVLEHEPERPSRINPRIDRNLETICLKCLNKEPTRRYGSALALAEDLECWLASKPIQARPMAWPERIWLWGRRRPVVAAMSAAVIALLLTVAVVSLTAARRTARHARELRLNLYVADMNVAYQAIQDDELALARQLLNKYRPHPRRARAAASNEPVATLEDDLRGWEWRYLWKLSRGDASAILRGHTREVSCVAFSPEGASLASASFDAEVRIWDLGTRRLRQRLTGFSSAIQRHSMVFSPAGEWLAVADNAAIHVFDATNWAKVRTLPNPAPPGRVNSVPIVFSRGGETIMCNVHGELRQWDTRTWEHRKTLLQSPRVDFGALLALSPDGRKFAIGTEEAVLVCNVSDPDAARPLFKIPVWWPMSVVFSPDSSLVAAGGPTTKAVVWNTGEGRETARLDSGLPLAFSPDSKQLATAGSAINLWEMGQAAPVASLKGHAASTLAFAPDGQTLASGNLDGTVALWRAVPQTATGRLSVHGERLGFSADGNVLAVLGTNASVQYWNLRSNTLVDEFTLPGKIARGGRIMASPDIRFVANVDSNGVVRVWDSRSPQTTVEIPLKHALRYPATAFSPDNRFLAVSCESVGDGGVGWAGVCDLEAGRVLDLPQTNCYRPAFSSDGRLLATGYNNQVQLWSLPDLKPLRAFSGHEATVKTLAFSAHNTVLASTGRSENGIRLWDVASGKLIKIIPTSSLNTVAGGSAWSLDGRTIASCQGLDAMLWNVATGRGLFTLPRLGEIRRPPLFSPDGTKLAVGGAPTPLGGGSPVPVEVLEAPSMEEIDALEGL